MIGYINTNGHEFEQLREGEGQGNEPWGHKELT